MDTIEHDFAGRYLGVWSRAAAADTDAGAAPRLLVVDASDDGPSAGPLNGGPDTHPLSALAGSLTASAAARTALVALREDPVAADVAHAALGRSGRAGRVHRAASASELVELVPGDAYVLEGNLATAWQALLPLVRSADRVLVRAAPTTPASAPFPALRALLEHPGLDLWVHLPLDDLLRLARYRTTPVADLPLHLRRLVEGYSSLLGDTRWEWLSTWRAVEAADGADAAAHRVAGRFRLRLAEAAAGGLTRLLSVPHGRLAGSTALQWVLATREPERVLDASRILFDLRDEGRLPWVEPRDPAVRHENPGVLDLFGEPSEPARSAGRGADYGPRVRVVDFRAKAQQLAIRFAGQVVPVREVMRSQADGELFADEVRQVLRLLRREGRVAYASLRSGDDLLRFQAPDTDARPPRRGTRRPSGPELW